MCGTGRFSKLFVREAKGGFTMGKKRWMLYLAVGVAAAAAAVITFFAAILPAAERSGRVESAAVVWDAGD